MPAKLERCVARVKKSSPGVDPWAVCVESTGIKRRKGDGWTRGKHHSATDGEFLESRKRKFGVAQ